jgi:hypothetical protein
LAIFEQCATLLMGIQWWEGSGAVRTGRPQGRRSSGGGGEELETITVKSFPLNKLQHEGTWAETWRAKRKRQSPLTGGNLEITTLPMCNGQRLVKSLQTVIISMTSRIPAKVDGIQFKEKFEPMIVSKEPNHSLGATPIGSVGRAPDEKKRREEKNLCRS